MRASVASLSKKFISTFFAATLALGLMPAMAFATNDWAEEGNDASLSVSEIINKDVPLDTVVAQAEAITSYFLAQTLETTRTIPMVSASVPLGTASEEVTEDVEAPYVSSTVMGSFERHGIVYAVEPGGESVAVVAADPARLSDRLIDTRSIVLPSTMTSNGSDQYRVARIAAHAFANLAFDGDGVTTIAIPASVIVIDKDAFMGFDTLEYLVIAGDNPNYSCYDGVLYNADLTRLLLIPGGRLGAVRIAPSATEVSPEAFSHCPSVDSLVADADSAAHQMLQENDFYNANGTPITEMILDVASADDHPVPYATTYFDLTANAEDSYAPIALSTDTIIRQESAAGDAYNTRVRAGGTCSILIHSCFANWVVPTRSLTSFDIQEGISRIYNAENDILTCDGGTYAPKVGTQGTYSWGIHPDYGFWFGCNGTYYLCLQSTWDTENNCRTYNAIFDSRDDTGAIYNSDYVSGCYYSTGNFGVTNPTERLLFESTNGATVRRASTACVWDSNGGSAGLIRDVKGITMSSFVAPDPGEKEGYVFKHWAKVENENQKVNRGATINVTANTRFIAVWEPAPFAVTFDSQKTATELAGTGKQPTVTVAKTSTVPFKYVTPIPDSLSLLPTTIASGDIPGYIFDGYYDKASGGKRYYDSDGAAVTETIDGVTRNLLWMVTNDDGKLFAHWTPISYKLAFSGNGSTSGYAPATKEMTYGEGYTIPPCSLLRTGYEFVGWATSPTGAKVYEVTEEVINLATSMNATATLYACWSALGYGITLAAVNYNGFVYGNSVEAPINETARDKSIAVTYGEAVGDEAIVVPRVRGYVFLGYYDAPQTEMAVSDGEDYAPRNMTCLYDRRGRLQQTDPWAYAESRTYYAHYYRIPYTIIFDLGDAEATGDSSSIEVYYGFPMSGITRKPSLAGHGFGGWKDVMTGSASSLFDSEGNGTGRYLVEGSTSLVADWSGKTYTITWQFDYRTPDGLNWSHCQGPDINEDGAKVEENVVYGAPITFPNPYDYSIAYKFLGWYTDMTGAVNEDATKLAKDASYFEEQADGTLLFKPSDDVGPSAITLYAGWSWSANPYRITLNAGGHGSFPGDEAIKPFTGAWAPNGANDVPLDYWKDVLDERAHAGWRFDHWIETTGNKNERYDALKVPAGTGDRAFKAIWKVDTGHSYSITFVKGTELSDFEGRPYDFVALSNSGNPSFDASDLVAATVPSFKTEEGTFVEETLGYKFDGWYRAKPLENGNYELFMQEGKLAPGTYSGQDLATIAKNAGTDKLYYMAVWTPKRFEVRYLYGDGIEMATNASRVFYDAEVTLASPVLEQTGNTGEIFSRWEGVRFTVNDPLLPGQVLTVSDLVKKAGETSVDRTTNTIWLHAEWTSAYSFTVPLVVNIVIDPEHPENTEKGEAWIETHSSGDVFVESVSFTRDPDLSTTLVAKGAPHAQDVSLTVRTEGASEPLKLDLAENAGNVYRNGLARYGLGTLGANERLNLVYDLELSQDCGLSFRDFTNLVNIKDAYEEDGARTAYPIGRVFYTLSESSLRTAAAEGV